MSAQLASGPRCSHSTGQELASRPASAGGSSTVPEHKKRALRLRSTVSLTQGPLPSVEEETSFAWSGWGFKGQHWLMQDCRSPELAQLHPGDTNIETLLSHVSSPSLQNACQRVTLSLSLLSSFTQLLRKWPRASQTGSTEFPIMCRTQRPGVPGCMDPAI